MQMRKLGFAEMVYLAWGEEAVELESESQSLYFWVSLFRDGNIIYISNEKVIHVYLEMENLENIE